MAKTLYRRRFGNNSGSAGIYSFSNGVWTKLSGGAGVSNAEYGWNIGPSGFVVYRGVLYAYRRRSDGLLEMTPVGPGGVGTPVTYTAVGGSVSFGGAPVEYKGTLVWNRPGGDTTIPDVRALVFDGTNLRVSNALGGYNALDAGVAEGLGHYAMAVKDRMVFASAGVTMSDPNSQSGIVTGYTYLDSSPLGVAAGARVQTHFLYESQICGGYAGILYANQFSGYENYDLSGLFPSTNLGMFTFKDKLYRVGIDACIYEIPDITAGTPVLKWDLKELSGWPTYTRNFTGFFATAVAGGWILWSFSNMTFMPDFIGARVTSATTGQSYTGIGASTSDLGMMDRATNKILKYGLPSNGMSDTLTVARSFGPGVAWTNHRRTSFAARSFQTFEAGGFVYILTMGASYANTGYTIDAEVSPSYLIKWDGVSAPTWTILTVFGGLTPDFVTCDGYYDASADQLHLVGVWRLTDETVHCIIKISDMSQTAPYPPGAGAWLQRHNYDGTEGALQGGFRGDWYWQAGSNLIGFNANEGDATVETSAVNTNGTVVTVVYKTYSADSHAVAVTIEVNNGGDWVSATPYTGSEALIGLSSSPSGVSHTFLHDAATQFPGAAQKLQYRVRVV